MPYLAKLLRSKTHRLHSFYPGQPSCTPAVQAEIHWGAKCATPAFSFYDTETRQAVRMYDAEWAKRIAEESHSRGPGLLENGSSYANIYTGGAKKAKFCGELNTFSHWSEELSLIRLIKLALKHPLSALRILKLLAIEIGIGIYDAVRGITSRGDFLEELSFIPTRLAVAIALREAIRSEVIDDIHDEIPIIHANFFSYDEAAHRRGPHSRFAHWTLKGLDGAIRKIAQAAEKSAKRNYRIICFSDHGQEHCTPYSEEMGKSLSDAVDSILPKDKNYRLSPGSHAEAFMERSQAILQDLEILSETDDESISWVHLQAMGPVAHLYVDGSLSPSEKRAWAKRLCQEAGVPHALYLDGQSEIVCMKKDQEGSIDILLPELEKRGHEFSELAIKDLSELIRSKYAGDFVLLGWRSAGKPLTFANERGAHAGPGAEECRGFAILPESVPWERQWLRPSDLRNIALTELGRDDERVDARPQGAEPNPASNAVRVVSYNVHGGVGIDRRTHRDRLAKVIIDSKADVVCFQEAFESEKGPSLSSALEKAWCDSLHYHFLELHKRNGIRYGLAIASRIPFELRKAAPFELVDKRIARREPRGSIWIEVQQDNGCAFHILNTHFGLKSYERILQAQELFTDEWLGSLEADDKIIICGDLNAGPKGPAYQTFAKRLSDAQLTANHGQASPSFISWAPLRRIDHIFASPQLSIPNAGVLTSPRIRMTSDHLPVYADIKSA